MSLPAEFDALADALKRLMALLEESEERFWLPYLKRGLRDVQERKLAGATSVLGCFGGQDTLSDLSIGAAYRDQDPLRYRNLNARLVALRTEVFECADQIASRRSW